MILEFAREGRPCTYKQFTDRLGVKWEEAHWRLPKILGEVSENEHAAGRPFLTAIVVAQSGACGQGFFEMVRSFGMPVTDEEAFQREEQQRVFDYWRQH